MLARRLLGRHFSVPPISGLSSYRHLIAHSALRLVVPVAEAADRSHRHLAFCNQIAQCGVYEFGWRGEQPCADLLPRPCRLARATNTPDEPQRLDMNRTRMAG